MLNKDPVKIEIQEWCLFVTRRQGWNCRQLYVTSTINIFWPLLLYFWLCFVVSSQLVIWCFFVNIVDFAYEISLSLSGCNALGNGRDITPTSLRFWGQTSCDYELLPLNWFACWEWWHQTLSTFGGRCRKAVLGVCGGMCMCVCSEVRDWVRPLVSIGGIIIWIISFHSVLMLVNKHGVTEWRLSLGYTIA